MDSSTWRTYWSGSISRELRCPFSQALGMGLPYASSNTLKFKLYLGTNGMHIRAKGNNLIQFSQVFWHSLTKVHFKVWLNLSTFLNDWSLQAECSVQFSSVQSLSRVRLFATPWIAARQASLSISNSQSSLRLTPIESVMPSSHLILRRPLLLPPIPPSIRLFPMSQLFAWGGQSTGVSASASFLLRNSQGWSPSEWTGWISLQSKGLSRVFSNSTVQKHQFFGAHLSSQSNSHIHTWPLEKP